MGIMDKLLKKQLKKELVNKQKELDVQMQELYEEAVEDCMKKYKLVKHIKGSGFFKKYEVLMYGVPLRRFFMRSSAISYIDRQSRKMAVRHLG